MNINDFIKQCILELESCENKTFQTFSILYKNLLGLSCDSDKKINKAYHNMCLQQYGNNLDFYFQMWKYCHKELN